METPGPNEGGNPSSHPSLSSPEPMVPDGSPSGSPTTSCGEKASPEAHVGAVPRSSQDQDTDTSLDSSIAASQQQSWKLSPMASPFRPILNQPLRPLHQVSLVPPGLAVMPPFPSTSHDLSSHLGLSRHLLFTPAAGNLAVAGVQGFLEKLGNLGFQYLGNRHVSAAGDSVSTYFTDIRDSCLVYTNAHLFGVDWDVRYMAGMTVSDTLVGGYLSPEGQLTVTAFIVPGAELEGRRAEAIVYQLLHSQAQIFCILEHSSFQSGTFRSTVEYCDVAAACAAAMRFADAVVEGIHLKAVMHSSPSLVPISGPGSTISDGGGGTLLSQDPNEPRCVLGGARPGQVVVMSPAQATPLSPYSPGSASSGGLQPSQLIHTLSPQLPRFSQLPYHASQDQRSRAQQCTATGMANHGFGLSQDCGDGLGRHGNTQNQSRMDFRRQNASRGGRGGGSYHGMPTHHNHVDIHRIREGTDVRTTIMLRNIPNKVDQAMLKRIIDESSWGKYDFMYLRIDFANDCNVGYAFINFVDPLDIVDFVNARGNQRWNCFKSDKVAEISYATIQGKDCLVQKFRNSSVMLEAPHYRPKLYFTSNGPEPDLAGQEEPFPEPDNQSKMKRSCENAEHVGLFTPNAGQHLRDEQRRRRSQYDRGTRLAALEEYDYETANQQHGYGQQ